MLVDVHRHHMPDTTVAFLRGRRAWPYLEGGLDGGLDGGFVRCTAGYGYRLTPEMTDISGNVAEMTESGVDTAVLSTIVGVVDQLPGPESAALARDVNDEMAALARTYPGRLVPMATLPLGDPRAAAEELRRALDLGLRGPIVPVTVAGRQLHELALDPLFEVAEATGAPLSLHPTSPAFAEHFGDHALMTSLAFPVDTTAAVLRLLYAGVFARYPGLRVVVPHAGSLLPYLMGRIDREAGKYGVWHEPPSRTLRRLHVDAVSLWPPAIRLLLEVMGPERVMFGSDYPFWSTGENVTALAEATADERVRAGTATDLFRL
ncbi:amidohydrolase family protein [Streptosporangium sp. NPDC051022]|uniref:amidohydrolase family protein n=1 Tax=Streptosporangium sp. NPDC051022 TaxID=3155752 RepID=UPI0034307882